MGQKSPKQTDRSIIFFTNLEKERDIQIEKSLKTPNTNHQKRTSL